MRQNMLFILFLSGVFLISISPPLPELFAEAPFIKFQKENNIRYMSGGVGVNERETMREMSKQFNLKLEFAVMSGQYLSRVTVKIYDTDGALVLHTISEGPWFMASLPDGNYKIVAIYKDREKVREVTIDRSRRTAMFHWNR